MPHCDGKKIRHKKKNCIGLLNCIKHLYVETYKMSNGLVFLGTNKHLIERSSIIDNAHETLLGSHKDECNIPIIVMGKSQIMMVRRY